MLLQRSPLRVARAAAAAVSRWLRASLDQSDSRPLVGSRRRLRRALPAWRRDFKDYLRTWEEARFLVDEYRELNEERMLVGAHYTGLGRTSGVELEQVRNKVAALFHLDGRKVTKLVMYCDGDRALAGHGRTSTTTSAILLPTTHRRLQLESARARTAGERTSRGRRADAH
jgi:hypothetical protein